MEKKAGIRGTQRRTMVGTIVSATMVSTVVVAVERFSKHPRYKKIVRRTKKFPAHNTAFNLTAGDKVKIAETKPLSKTKHFEVIEKLS